jgi:peptide/nickel transport system substrate-binding protein
VTATLERVLDPKVRSPRCGTMLRPLVAGVEAPDPATVVLRLRFPTGALLSSLASAWCRVVPRHVLQRHGDLNRPEAQVGTGPFRFTRYERGSLIEWERNPDYFRPGRPYLDGVRQFVIPSLPRQLAAAKAGQVLLSGGNLGMTRTQADELRRARPEAELYLWPLNTLAALHLNAVRGPFREKDLRRAAFLAIDRLALFRKVHEGDGVPCAILDPKLFGAFALPLAEVQAVPGCRPARAEDLEEARRLVARHYPQGVDVDVVIRAFGAYADRAQLVIEDLRRVGIRGRLRTLESAAGFLAFERGEFDVIGGQDTGMVTTDPSGVFAVLFTSQAGRNWEGWSDATVDQLADEALRNSDPERRRELYHALQRRLLTVDTGAIPLGWIEGWYFRDPRVRGYRPTLSIYDGNAFEDVWLAR